MLAAAIGILLGRTAAALEAEHSDEVAVERGRSLAASARYEEAIIEYRRVIALAPGWRVQEELARTLVLAGRYDEAVVEYREIVAQMPEDRELRRSLARALSSAERRSEAIPHLDVLIAGDPGDLDALTERALIARWQGDFGTARRLLRQARAAEARNGDAEETEDPGPRAPRQDVTVPLLAGLLGVAIVLGQRRPIARRSYLLLAVLSASLVGAGLSWLYLVG
jgi:Flp pilus assembly protein TadD